MADQKITELSPDTAPTIDDLIVTVNDPGGTPANKKITVANFMTAANMKNPYKFRVYRNSAYNSVSATPTVIPYDTKNYDTGTNIDVVTNKGRFTAPVAGFYQFNATYSLVSSAGFVIIYLYKNGAQYALGNQWLLTSASGASASYSDIVQSAANDYWEIAYYVDGIRAMNVGATAGAYFSGFLVSIT